MWEFGLWRFWVQTRKVPSEKIASQVQGGGMVGRLEIGKKNSNLFLSASTEAS